MPVFTKPSNLNRCLYLKKNGTYIPKTNTRTKRTDEDAKIRDRIPPSFSRPINNELSSDWVKNPAKKKHATRKTMALRPCSTQVCKSNLAWALAVVLRLCFHMCLCCFRCRARFTLAGQIVQLSDVTVDCLCACCFVVFTKGGGHYSTDFILWNGNLLKWNYCHRYRSDISYTIYVR